VSSAAAHRRRSPQVAGLGPELLQSSDSLKVTAMCPRNFLFGLVLALASATAGCSRESTPAPTAAAESSPTPVATAPTHGLPDFAGLVEQYGKAVVNIEVVGRAQLTSLPELPLDDPFFEFFRRFGMPLPDGRRPAQPPVLRGAGSGFIVSPDGYILTNAHVVANADEVTVRLADRREFGAKVIGSDSRTDVAVIKIDAEELPTVRIGDHTKLRPGEWVLAIGSPFGLESTATAGIVSATSRAVGAGETDVPFIQTDVAVNPGNSGGPLFNLRGEVVGINSMIFSQTGGYMGISFAVPIDVAMHVRDQLVKTGRVVRGRIGVTVQNVNAALATSFGLDRPRGALVSSVEEDSPADKAGLRAGDVILRVNDEPIEQSNNLSSLISRQTPGETCTLTIWRGRKEQTLKVRIAELEERERDRVSDKDDPAAQGGARLGLLVRPLTAEEKKASGASHGLMVERASGNAARAGVQPGDIVVALNDRQIRTVEDLRSATRALQEGATAALLILREGGQIFVPVRVGKSAER
jgi:serine protease Do